MKKATILSFPDRVYAPLVPETRASLVYACRSFKKLLMFGWSPESGPCKLVIRYLVSAHHIASASSHALSLRSLACSCNQALHVVCVVASCVTGRGWQLLQLLHLNLLQSNEKEVKHVMENPLLDKNETKTQNLFQQSKHSHKRLVDTLGSKAVDFLEVCGTFTLLK